MDFWLPVIRKYLSFSSATVFISAFFYLVFPPSVTQSSQTQVIVHIHKHFHSFVQNKWRMTSGALLLLKLYNIICNMLTFILFLSKHLSQCFNLNICVEHAVSHLSALSSMSYTVFVHAIWPSHCLILITSESATLYIWSARNHDSSSFSKWMFQHTETLLCMCVWFPAAVKVLTSCQCRLEAKISCCWMYYDQLWYTEL